jgi:hypothetical protein
VSGGALGGGRMVEDSSSVAGNSISIASFYFVDCRP